MPGLVCVTYWAVRSAQEQSRSLTQPLGVGAYRTTASPPRCGVIHPRLGREQLVLTIMRTLQSVAVLGAKRS